MTFPRRRLEPVVQRVRARIGKRIILDTTHAQLLFEDERHPWRAVRGWNQQRASRRLLTARPLPSSATMPSGWGKR
jgi:hypothetical protein